MGEGFTLSNICSHNAAWKLLTALLDHLLNAHTFELVDNEPHYAAFTLTLLNDSILNQ